MPVTILGWDIGGVNTKVAAVNAGAIIGALSHPYEIQSAPQQLTPLLATLAVTLSAAPVSAHAVTMTAELSQLFRTKREGVGVVLDAVAAAFPSDPVYVFTVDGVFVGPAEARLRPLNVAAANWMATAMMVAEKYPDAVLIDVGTTTTDVIPIANGVPVPIGRTDPERLASGELVYTGAVRTPVEAVASRAPFRDGTAGVAAEGFALMGDVHVYRGALSPADYTTRSPDGRAVAHPFVAERLARSICADREMLTGDEISRIADTFAAAQRATISIAVQRVLERHPSLTLAVVTGLGSFIAEEVALGIGLRSTCLSKDLGTAAARSAPATAVALLLEHALAQTQHDAAH